VIGPELVSDIRIGRPQGFRQRGELTLTLDIRGEMVWLWIQPSNDGSHVHTDQPQLKPCGGASSS